VKGIAMSAPAHKSADTPAVKPAVKPADIEAMIEVFNASDWDEMHIEMEGFELFLSNDPKARLPGPAAPAPAVPAPAPAGLPAAAPGPAAAAAAAPAAGAVPAHWVAVTAPNLGTFYRAPKPGAAPYCEVGSSVTEDSELCLIEVMKLFTTLRSGVAGTVRRIDVPDGAMVEHGQTLFWIEP
jgi:acetyl-CoA carboxylase biotin carboxyl carrier protein